MAYGRGAAARMACRQSKRRIQKNTCRLEPPPQHLDKTYASNLPTSGKDFDLAMEESAMAFSSCVFISDFLTKSGVADRVVKAIGLLDKPDGYKKYHQEYWAAVNEIVKAAKDQI